MTIFLTVAGTLVGYFLVGLTWSRLDYVWEIDHNGATPNKELKDLNIVLVFLWPVFAVIGLVWGTCVGVKRGLHWLLFRETRGQKRKRLNAIAERADRENQEYLAELAWDLEHDEA